MRRSKKVKSLRSKCRYIEIRCRGLLTFLSNRPRKKRERAYACKRWVNVARRVCLYSSRRAKSSVLIDAQRGGRPIHRRGVSWPFKDTPIDDMRDRVRRERNKETRPLWRRVSYWRDRVAKGSRHRVSIPRILSSGFLRRTKEIGQIIGSSDTQVGQSFWVLRTLRKDHCARDTRYIRIEWLDTGKGTWP